MTLSSNRLRISTVNVRKPGKNRVHFGSCLNDRALLRYLLIEGWKVGAAQCNNCGYRWNMSIEPEKLPKLKDGVQVVHVVDQPCLKCGGLATVFLHVIGP